MIREYNIQNNMKLYFENARGEQRLIATVANKKEAMEEMNKFCNERKFKIHYVRAWKKKNGDTIYDVGSHTEQFILST